MSKDFSAFIFHFKQLEYLQAVCGNAHTHTHRHAHGHIPLSLVYTDAGKGNDLSEPMKRKGKATLLPQARSPTTISNIPFPHAELHARLVGANIIHVDDLLKLQF